VPPKDDAFPFRDFLTLGSIAAEMLHQDENVIAVKLLVALKVEPLRSVSDDGSVVTSKADGELHVNAGVLSSG
jgi:hypothetical protein